MYKKEWTIYIALLALVAGSFYFVYRQVLANLAIAKNHYQQSAYSDAEANAEVVTNNLKQIYQNLRTISLLPSVTKINRHGTNIDGDAILSIQQIYNNLKYTINVSEVYIVPVDLEPDKIDPFTQKPERPILIFDNLIAGAVDNKVNSQVSPHEQVEIYEYRQFKEQLSWFQVHYPDASTFDIMTIPIISGPELITCDNSAYDFTLKDIDRKGLIFSVPFYGPDNKLKGSISAIILNNAIQQWLPDHDYALVNQHNKYILWPAGSGQERISEPFIQNGKMDPTLIFSTTIPILLNDPISRWFLWVGLPDSHFTQSNEMHNILVFKYTGYSIVCILSLLFVVFWHMSKHLKEIESSKQQLEVDSQFKSEFLSGLSHTLRSPMNGIIGISDLLMTETPELNSKFRDYLKYIRHSSESLLNIINGILDIAKLDSRHHVISHIPFNLKKCVESEMKQLSSIVSQKHLICTLDYDCPINGTTIGDPERIKQVLRAIIENAARFTETGSITVKVRAQIHTHNQIIIYFEITDTGIGIAPAPLRKLKNWLATNVIDELYTHNKKNQHIGLGLILSKRLIKAMEGQLYIDSELGQGTVIKFNILLGLSHIPLDPAKATITQASSSILMQHNKILIADDVTVNRILLHNLLEKAGFHNIDSAEDGKKALAKMLNYQYDLIFMDCQMPIISGCEASKTFRSWATENNKPHTIIVALTADKDFEQNYQEYGMDYCLLKPVSQDKLQELLVKL